MSIVNGEELFYVNARGDVHNVIATSDERNGSVSIKGATIGSIESVGTLHVCRTLSVANIMSKNRRRIEVPLKGLS